MSINENQTGLRINQDVSDTVFCLLEKKMPDTVCKKQFSGLPPQYAKKGKILRLRDTKGVWEEGWLVKEVFECPTRK